jgi:hypothetical protein
MKIFEKLGERRRRKLREAHLRERDRQKALNSQDAQSAIRGTATESGAAQQGMFGHGT